MPGRCGQTAILIVASALLAAGCAAQTKNELVEHRTAESGMHLDVSPRDTPVESFVLVDVEEANAAAAAAASEGAQWPRDPLEVAQRFAGPAGGRYVNIEKVDEPSEFPAATTITIVDGSYLDDSVWGVWNQLFLSRQDDGAWRIDEARRAWRCYRGHQTGSFGEQWCL